MNNIARSWAHHQACTQKYEAENNSTEKNDIIVVPKDEALTNGTQACMRSLQAQVETTHSNVKFLCMRIDPHVSTHTQLNRAPPKRAPWPDDFVKDKPARPKRLVSHHLVQMLVCSLYQSFPKLILQLHVCVCLSGVLQFSFFNPLVYQSPVSCL
jgi:hypothetical protein